MSELESNLMNAGVIDSIIIEAADGKEYKIEKKLPVKAGNIFNGLVSQYGFTNPATPDEIIENNDKMMDMLMAVVIAANKIKYPELTKDYIENNFDEFDLGYIYNMYLARWYEINNRKMKSRTIDKKKEPEKPTKDA